MEVKPLTVFIGKNSVGKSFLAQMIWALATTEPDHDVWVDILSERLEEAFGGLDPYEELLKRIRSGGEVTDIVKKILNVYIETAYDVLAVGLKRRLEEVFESLDNVVMEGASEANIRIEGRALIEFKLTRENVYILDYKPNLDLGNVYVKTQHPGRLIIKMSLEEETINYYYEISSPKAGLRNIMSLVAHDHLSDSFGSLFYGGREHVLFPDSRAGVSRVLLRQPPRFLLVRGVKGIDVEYLEFIQELIWWMPERGCMSKDVEESLRELLEELGCKLEIVRKAGRRELYLRMWNGRRL